MNMFKMFHTIHKESPFTVLHTLVFTVVQKKLEAEASPNASQVCPINFKTNLLTV